MLLRLSFLLVLQLLYRLLHDSTPMLIIKADKDQLNLLKEASLDDRLRGKEVFQVLDILFERFLKETQCERKVRNNALFREMIRRIILFV